MTAPVPGNECHKISILIENVAKKVCLYDKKFSRDSVAKKKHGMKFVKL